MSKFQAPEFPAMVFFIHENRRTSLDSELKCPECQYPIEKIKKQMCQSSVGTNPKNPNFEHPNFGISELRTPRTYLKKYKSNSNFRGRTSNF